MRQGFDGLGFREHAALSAEQGFDPGAQARPVALRQVNQVAQIEQGDLADLFAGAFGGDEAEREVGFVGGFIPRRGFADEHGGEVGPAAGVVKGTRIILWHYKVSQKFIGGFPGGFLEFVTVCGGKSVKDGLKLTPAAVAPATTASDTKPTMSPYSNALDPHSSIVKGRKGEKSYTGQASSSFAPVRLTSKIRLTPDGQPRYSSHGRRAGVSWRLQRARQAVTLGSPAGQLIFTADGHMSYIITWAELPAEWRPTFELYHGQKQQSEIAVSSFHEA